MKISTERLKQIIKEEIKKLHELHEEETETPPLDFTNLLMELQRLLDEWEQKEYPSDEARYKGYYEDVKSLVGKYNSCAHPGQACEEAHEGQTHEECVEGKQEMEN